MAVIPAGDPAVVVVIPARGGSVRLPRKNIRLLAGHPLVAYTIAIARAWPRATTVLVSTEDDEIATVARAYGAEVVRRDRSLASDGAPDVGWLRAVLLDRPEPCFCLLRPTSPCRSVRLLERAWETWVEEQPCDSLRTVRRAREHPGKMWTLTTTTWPAASGPNPAIGSVVTRHRLLPVLPYRQRWQPTVSVAPLEVPWHSLPTQTLPSVYVQTSSLEIGWRSLPLPPSGTVAGSYADDGTLAGSVIAPCLTEGAESWSLDEPEDWIALERAVATGEVSLPLVPKAPS